MRQPIGSSGQWRHGRLGLALPLALILLVLPAGQPATVEDLRGTPTHDQDLSRSGTRGESCATYLFHSVLLTPHSLGPEESGILEIRVTTCLGQFVPDVPVTVVSERGASISPSTGTTDEEGRFEGTYTAPRTHGAVEDRLSITVVNEDGSELTGMYRVGLLSAREGASSGTPWLAALTIAATVGALLVYFRRRRR